MYACTVSGAYKRQRHNTITPFGTYKLLTLYTVHAEVGSFHTKSTKNPDPLDFHEIWHTHQPCKKTFLYQNLEHFTDVHDHLKLLILFQVIYNLL